MPSLRKRPLLPPPAARKPWLTIDRTLLGGVVLCVGFGFAQPNLLLTASNDTKQPAGATQIAVRGSVPANLPNTDFTPIGAIDHDPAKTPADAAKPPQKLHLPERR